MIDFLDEIIFFPKSLDDLDGLFPPNCDYKVYACRSSKEVYNKYQKAYVYEAETGNRLFSTTKFFRKILASLDIADSIAQSKGVWSYQAYPWCDDLRNMGCQVFAISHLLYSTLHNKFMQKQLLINAATNVSRKAGKHLLRHFELREHVFKTKIMFYKPDSFSQFNYAHPNGFVVANSTSDGGSNVFRVHNSKDYEEIIPRLSSPVVRIEALINDSLPINQIGIVTDNGWVIKYQPSVQLIKINKISSRFEYIGSNYSLVDFGVSYSDSRIRSATVLTDSVGKALYAMGYRGIFGCDYLLTDKEAFFMELNPRYQASTRVLSVATEKQPEFSPHIIHIASFLKGKAEANIAIMEYSAPDSFIKILKKDDAHGYVRVWDKNILCDRQMVGREVVEPIIHIGYNLLKGTSAMGSSLI